MDFNWLLFAVLALGGIGGLLSALPLYAGLTVSAIPKALAGATSETPRTKIALKVVARGTVVFLPIVIAVAVGLEVSQYLGLGAPILTAWLTGDDVPNFSNAVWPGIQAGAACGFFFIVLSFAISRRFSSENMFAFYRVALWKRLLATIFYAGIVEELVFRLFLLSVMAWFLGLLLEGPDPSSTETLWFATIMSAAVFALAHLPGPVAVWGSASKVPIALTLMGNGIAGVTYGYLFWRWGLEAAIIAHMVTHIVLQIVHPLCAPIFTSGSAQHGAPADVSVVASRRQSRG